MGNGNGSRECMLDDELHVPMVNSARPSRYRRRIADLAFEGLRNPWRNGAKGHGASSTPHMKSNCSDPASTAGIGFPVGLKGSIAVALEVGLPRDPKEA
jgi:hypothetical protein